MSRCRCYLSVHGWINEEFVKADGSARLAATRWCCVIIGEERRVEGVVDGGCSACVFYMME